MSEDQPPRRSESATRDHLANQRTYLAWVRTAVTFVGLGFAVDRLLVEDAVGSVLGVAMMIVGGAMMLPALVSYRRTERVIETGAPLQPMSWATPLAVVVVGGAVVLVLFSLVRR
jgi:putative membrane protein